jgi:hypothetical protein
VKTSEDYTWGGRDVRSQISCEGRVATEWKQRVLSAVIFPHPERSTGVTSQQACRNKEAWALSSMRRVLADASWSPSSLDIIAVLFLLFTTEL